jgi:hypothetical protein
MDHIQVDMPNIGAVMEVKDGIERAQDKIVKETLRV